MRVALVSDIHGHLLALDAVLADIAKAGVDLTVCLGDIALFGPRPGGCVERVRSLGCPVVMGNCDQAVVDYYRAQGVPLEHAASYERLGGWVREIDVWSALAVSEDEAAWLAALPLTARVELGHGAALLLAHGSPSSYSARLTPEMPDDELRAALGGVEKAGLVGLACGHTHLPMVRDLGSFTVINPGSVGMPMAKDAADASYNPADYAEYAIATWEHGALAVDLRHVALDAEAVRADIAASGMPRADRWRTDMRRN